MYASRTKNRLTFTLFCDSFFLLLVESFQSRCLHQSKEKWTSHNLLTTSNPKPAAHDMNSFFIPLPLQNIILNTQRTLFCISTILNVMAFACLISKTPESQKKFRNYLLYMQAMITVFVFSHNVSYSCRSWQL